MLSPTLSSYFLSIVAAFLIVRLVWRDRRRLPPGPRRLPLLGNLFDLPKSYSWLTYKKWGEEYGPLIFLSALGSNIVIANSYKTAIELMDKKSNIYSSRKLLTMPMKLLGWDQTMGFLQYGPKYRAYRKLLQGELGTMSAVHKYAVHQESQTVQFLKTCLESPQNMQEHVDHHSAALALRITFGYNARTHNDKFITALKTYMHAFSLSASPNKFMVNHFPILRYVPEWLPGAGFKKVARRWAPLYGLYQDPPFEFVKDQMASGLAEKSFTSSWLEQHLSAEEEDNLRHVAGAMFAGGADTTAAQMYAFFLFMCLYPECQKQAQAEMDRVVGKGNLPTLNDRPNLPYLEALTKEIMRVHIIGPGGLPHYSTEDDVHDGYFIAKNTVVIPNMWAMSRDPSVYSNPDIFNPNRFLGPNPEQDPREYVFGFGRRICPGRLLAETFIYTTFAMCIAALDISPIERDGVVQMPEFKPRDGTISISDIVWSSITVIFTCTWLSFHPNISNPYERWWKTQARSFGVMTVALLAPELFLAEAVIEWMYAREIAKRYKDRGWTLTHGFFVVMGGFVACENGSILEVINADNLERYVDQITVGEDELVDRGKSDALAKIIAAFQTTWFILQIIARAVQNLPIAELELVATAFAVMNLGIYLLWWDKPKDVAFPVFIGQYDGNRDKERLREEWRAIATGRTSMSDDVELGELIPVAQSAHTAQPGSSPGSPTQSSHDVQPESSSSATQSSHDVQPESSPPNSAATESSHSDALSDPSSTFPVAQSSNDTQSHSSPSSPVDMAMQSSQVQIELSPLNAQSSDNALCEPPSSSAAAAAAASSNDAPPQSSPTSVQSSCNALAESSDAALAQSSHDAPSEPSPPAAAQTSHDLPTEPSPASAAAESSNTTPPQSSPRRRRRRRVIPPRAPPSCFANLDRRFNTWRKRLNQFLDRKGRTLERYFTHHFRVPRSDKDAFIAGGILIFLAALFGGIHCIAWNFDFPTRKERILWRVASIVGTAGPVLMAPNPMVFFPYVGARMVLLVEPFVLLRPGAYPEGMLETVEWVKFLPHFG
ncbi:hypothetical protein D9758_004438 [Tetrapyrgos nigripes]|uniref:Cytochrome P450 n=1 Tax=Tetrapyrgos nigripes TaxID=182062 RepID=A0A8H5GNA1_9AGAR|nr:hypothetical protein D9758_004438 [Tetrapyrgos nigripes]